MLIDCLTAMVEMKGTVRALFPFFHK